MGNFASCSSLTSKTSEVIFPSGEVHQFHRPVKAAELMLESPDCFLVNTKSLNIGKRFSALSADEDLEFGNIYVMFTMKRLRSVVTSDDMAVLLIANPKASTISGASHNKVRVLPESVPVGLPESETEGSRFSFEEAEGFKYKFSVSRSRKPLLDTIAEEQSQLVHGNKYSSCFPRVARQPCLC